MDFNFTNANEMTKEEFESQKNFNHWQVFTADQVKMYGVEVAKMISKATVNELSPEEQDMVKVGKTELKHLKEVRIVEKVDNHIVKSVVYVQEPQTRVEDTLEKSTDGTPVQKITFLNTELNQELGRVGVQIIKGKKNDEPIDKEVLKAMMNSDVYKSLKSYMEKGMKDEEIMENIKKAFPDVDEKKVAEMKKAFGTESKAKMAAAEKTGDDPEDEEED